MWKVSRAFFFNNYITQLKLLVTYIHEPKTKHSKKPWFIKVFQQWLSLLEWLVKTIRTKNSGQERAFLYNGVNKVSDLGK